MKIRWLPLIAVITIYLESIPVHASKSHKLVKRQFPSQLGGGSIPLSRRRQFPPPEEYEYVSSEDEERPQEERTPFRGHQKPPESSEEDYSEEYTYTEAPKVTTPVPQKPTSRTVVFNNRFVLRPRPAQEPPTKSSAPTPATRAPNTSPSSYRATPAQSQRLDVVANILNKTPPPRSSIQRSLSTSSRTGNENFEKRSSLTEVKSTTTKRPATNLRVRTRGRAKPRVSSTTTTTTETPIVEYYYYYEDDEDDSKSQPIATTTSTTTTTTTARPRPTFRSRPAASRSRSTNKPVFKFDPDSQFVPPPEKPLDVVKLTTPRPNTSRNRFGSKPEIKFDPESQFVPPPDERLDIVQQSSSSTKRFTTSSTMSPEESGGIPPHLRSKYRPRTDGRFIDFLRDPNRPRELKGFDLTDYPFYIKVPEDIVFDCDDKKDGYYASIPHHCQLFHYCFAGSRYDFLCANYTLYDQTTFTCRFANNVDCLSSEKYYSRNDDLWKETTTTTTKAPETQRPRSRRPRPRDEDYEDEEEEYEEEDDEYEDEEVGRRRKPQKRRRNRKKNRRRPKPDDDE